MKIVVIGLGYVGLPLAMALSKNFNVVGFDTNVQRTSDLKDDYDSNMEFKRHELEASRRLEFTSDEEHLKETDLFIVAVPTPVKDKTPDLTYVESATKTIAKFFTADSMIVYESTLAPGCTRGHLIPLLVENLTFSIELDQVKFGFSPERVAPGRDSSLSELKKIPKLISANTEENAQSLKHIYETFMEAPLHIYSIEEAEMSKLLENIQRDVNFALMNEMSSAANQMGIDFRNVLEAAKTKPNFLPFNPGFVGGHCIPVDPWYMVEASKEVGIELELTQAARNVNDGVVSGLGSAIISECPDGGTVLILGASYKEEIYDTRNSGAFALADYLNENSSLDISVTDPYLTDDEIPPHQLNFVNEAQALDRKYSCVVIAVNHIEYRFQTEEYFRTLLEGENGLLIDCTSSRGDINL